MRLDLSPQPPPLAYDADGNIRIAGTRVTLDSILSSFKQDFSAEEIAYHFPTVGLSHIYATIAYYLAHQAEVKGYVEQQHREGEAVRQWFEAQQGTQGLIERSLEHKSEVERAKYCLPS